ncbi:Na+/H+ antiporter NhaA [Candidatus Thorarchaeota archaeon]|nr:MAG: Na+/H+ antiporter NhaA [Candidatus Thorarchaeota archaeon]
MPPKRKHFKKGKPNQIVRIAKPFRQFMQYEASGGLVLLACVVISLVIANLPIGDSYVTIWDTAIGLVIGPFSIEKPLLFWINDLLMVFFFFLIGLEVKGELLIGELSSRNNALAPVIGAMGGMIVPAFIFVMFNPIGSQGANAWAIPIATDIAIVLGLLSIFGKKVPTSLKIFITTLAITDDIGGVIIIALLYSHGFSLLHLELAALVFILLITLNRIGIRHIAPYALLGIFLWLEFLLSGIHPTITGILIALSIPATTKIDHKEFKERSNQIMHRINIVTEDGSAEDDIVVLLNLSRTLEMTCKDIEAPLQQAEHALTKWLAFMIVPVFALANSAISVAQLNPAMLVSPISIGIILGLIIGKPLGVLLAMWVGIKIGQINLPKDVDWEMMISVSFLTGIGFTISTFIASLAIADPILLTTSKVAILSASMISGVIGFLSFRHVLRKREIASFPYVAPEVPETLNIIVAKETPVEIIEDKGKKDSLAE